MTEEEYDRQNLANIIEPIICSVCSDGNSNSKQLAMEIADRVLRFVYGNSPGSVENN
jgi:hypothetical protein